MQALLTPAASQSSCWWWWWWQANKQILGSFNPAGEVAKGKENEGGMGCKLLSPSGPQHHHDPFVSIPLKQDNHNHHHHQALKSFVRCWVKYEGSLSLFAAYTTH